MEDLDKRIKEAAAEGAEHYDVNTSMYNFGKHVGYIRGFQEGIVWFKRQLSEYTLRMEEE